MTIGLSNQNSDQSEANHSSQKVYSRSYRVFHWLMGLGFSLLLIAGQQFNLNLSEAYKLNGLRYHSSIGSIVLVAATILLIKRLIRRDARPHSGLNGVKLLAAHGAQFTLYFLAVFIPLSGIATAYYSATPTWLFGIFNLAQGSYQPELYGQIRQWHEWATFVGISLAGLHICAALYHHFYKKDEVLKSMLGRNP